MPSKDLIQVNSYITPELKKMIDAKVKESEIPMSISAYIGLLIRRDLKKRRAA